MTDEWFKDETFPGCGARPWTRWGTRYACTNLPEDGKIVVYCGGLTCPQRRMAAEKLAKLGYENVRADEGGLEGAGFAVEKA